MDLFINNRIIYKICYNIINKLRLFIVLLFALYLSSLTPLVQASTNSLELSTSSGILLDGLQSSLGVTSSGVLNTALGQNFSSQSLTQNSATTSSANPPSISSTPFPTINERLNLVAINSSSTNSSIVRSFSGKIRHSLQVRELAKHQYKGNEGVSYMVLGTYEKKVSVRVVNSDNSEIPLNISYSNDGEDTDVVIKPLKHIKPGKYKIQTFSENVLIGEQTVIWGVLAINTDKTLYKPGEDVHISLAVLDEKGMMVCDAAVEVVIITPNSQRISLKTSNGTIRINPSCQVHDYTDIPDYEASYVPSKTGNYDLIVTATTKQGSYTLTDAFVVDDAHPFSIERQSATRIYTPKRYPMKITVTAEEDFKGAIIDAVPQEFEITKLPGTTEYDALAITDPNLFEESASVSGRFIQLSYPFAGKHPLTNFFGSDVDDPGLKQAYQLAGLRGHDGVDFALPEHTSILAVDDGTIAYTGYNPYGNTLIIQHAWGRSYYGHLSEYIGIVGQKIKKGDVVALSGSTGLSTGPHLHFGMRLSVYDSENGYYGKINPLPYLQSMGSIVSNNAFQEVRWMVDLKKGEKVTLGYNYLAPLTSPYLYFLGPLRLFTDKQSTISGTKRGPTTLFDQLLFESSPSSVSSKAAEPLPTNNPTTTDETPTLLPPNNLLFGNSEKSVETQSSESGLIFPTVKPTPTILPTPTVASVSGILQGNLLEPIRSTSASSVSAEQLLYPFDASSSGKIDLFSLMNKLFYQEGRLWQIAADAAAQGSWWNASYLRRQKITISTTTATPTAYSVSVTIDHANMVTNAQSLASGDDVRVVYWNGTSWAELDRALDQDSTWNSSATKIWFATQGAIGASSTNDNYYLYYDYSSATSPPANKSNIYLWWDDFNRADNANITTESNYSTKAGGATWSISSNKLVATGSSGDPNKLLITALGTSPGDVLLQSLFRVQTKSGSADANRGGLSCCMDTGVNGQGYNIQFHQTNNRFEFLNDTRSWGTNTTNAWVNATWYLLKFAVITPSSKNGSAKFWLPGSAEPAWMNTGNFGAGAARGYGYVGFSASNVAADVLWWDDIIVRKIVTTEPTSALSTADTGATLDKLMRHGNWFFDGVEQSFTF